MKRKTSIILGVLVLLCQYLNAQSISPRTLPAQRTNQPIKIDGILDDAAWKDAPKMTDLVEFRPVVGKKELFENRTESFLLYDDEGIYFGGYCHERTKDSIASELAGRDGFGNNDYIGIIFDTYYDKQNGFEYFLTPLGEQWDAKMWPNPTGNGEDFSWNGVWKSGVQLHNDGWTFEMFIPYSAIRFGKKEVQNWGLNITRRRRKTEQQYTWNPIDPNVNGFLTQEAMWTGITNIKPPLRLQFSPYIAANTNYFPTNDPSDRNWNTSISGGMDVKYGINQAFTLDATLVPDFGQVQSDNRVLNLTPFEIKYTENRPFFTEGTELFTKGNLFYARRIGIDPVLNHSAYDGLQSEEKILKNPSESKLINATKISGRTTKGLGVGILNAVTNNRFALIENTSTKNTRRQLVDPLTNYNVFVLDQTLKNNSSISLVNTNVWRSGSDYDANVTAGLFSINDKKNMYNLSGKFASSTLFNYLPNNESQTGYSHSIGFGKTSGSFNFQVGQELSNEKFNSNDMGYFTFTNFLDHFIWIGRRWTKPGKVFNNIFLNFNAYYSRRLKPATYQSANFNMNLNGQLKNLWYVGGLVGYEPESNNFYEPRKAGRVFRGWSNYFVSGWFETNNSKKFKLNTEVMYVKRNLFSSERYSISFSPRYRFSKKLSVNYSIELAPQNNNVGFAAINGEDIIFGKRDIQSVENIMNIKYSFNDKMNLNTRIRHYWSKVDNKEFFTLLENGHLQPDNNFTGDVNQNYNAFNIDAVFTWQFAPGSFLNFVWKDAAYDFNRAVNEGYFKNFNNTMKADDNNNISIKVIYFLDYLTMKSKWKKNSKG
ncbi:MAG: carbohydrate binding family 9 domain-containing protein [Chitinophagaceae bacterium]|nr:carbohydrate binding family 9 domain-containing protein [Chitinophagaceae bacterium]